MRLLLSMFSPRRGTLPQATSSLPVGMNPTRGLRATGIWYMPAVAMAQSSSGVRKVPASTTRSPFFTSEPAWLTQVPGLTSMPFSMTRLPASRQRTCSAETTASNSSGKSSPVSACAQSTSRTQPAVSGSPSAQALDLTAMPSHFDER